MKPLFAAPAGRWRLLFFALPFFLLFQTDRMFAQCGNSDWLNLISDACGDLQPSGGLADGSPTIFCEGEIVTVENNSTPSADIQNTYIDWGDGTCQVFPGLQTAMTHSFDFPNDTCISNSNGTIVFQVKLGVGKSCGGSSSSFNFVQFNVVVRFKPVARFTASPLVACFDKPIDFNNTSCKNSANPTYLWNMGNGETFVTEDVSGYLYADTGFHSVSLQVTNICGTSTVIHSVQVVPAPVAMAGIQISDFCAPAVAQLSSAGTLYASMLTWEITAASGGTWAWADTTFNAHHPNPKIIFLSPGTYTIRLIVKGAPGCDDAEVTLAPIVIRASPAAAWNVPNTGCFENNMFVFDPSGSNNGTGGYPTLSYQWFFPGGTPASFSGQNPPPVTYTQIGTYDIVMVLTGDSDPGNPCGRDTLKQTLVITAEALPAVSLSGIPANACGPFTVTASNTSTGAGGWEWTVSKNGQPATQPADFEYLNGTNKDSQNPVIRLNAPGDFTLKLQLENVACGNNTVWQQMIVVKTAPSFTLVPPASACVPTQVTFGTYLQNFNNGNDPAALPVWNFGIGMPASFTGLNPPPVSYTQAGTAVVMVSDTNACGSISDTIFFQLIAKDQVVVLPAIDSLCKNETPLQLSAGNIASPGWPAAAPAGVVDPQMLNNGWNYLRVTNGASDPGCLTADTAAIFVVDVPVNIGMLPDFCDTVGTAQITGFMPMQNITFSGGNYVTPGGLVSASIAGFGQHPVLLVYQDPSPLGCTFADSLTFSVFELPASGITAPSTGCTATGIPFAFPGDPTGISFEWDFGDGSAISTQANPTHLFSLAGEFTVTLTVRNGNDCTDQATHAIHIEAPLSFSLGVVPGDTCAEQPVMITCNVTGQNPQWNLFIGTLDTLPNFTSGTFSFPSGVEDTTYILTAAGNNACPLVSSTAEVLIHPLPHAVLGASNLLPCSGDTVTFNWNLSTGIPITEYLFDSGNGYTGTVLPAAGIRYFANGNAPATYYATLKIVNQCGTDIDTVQVTALPESIVPFVQLSDTLLCVYDTLSLTSFAQDTSSGHLLHISYHFSNGDVVDQSNASYVFTEPGHYRITQWVTDECAWDSVSRWVTVRPAPPADFSWAPDTICAGSTITFHFLPDPAYLSLSWSSAGISLGSGVETTTAWTQPGWKTVRLQVRHDTTGCMAALEKNVHIRANPAPRIEVSDSIGCGRLTAAFTAINLGAGQFHEWLFSDGTTDVGMPVVHTFDSVGLYDALFHTEDIWGCAGEDTFDGLLVNPLPGSVFVPSLEYGCGTPTILSLDNQTMNALGARWWLDGTFLSSQTDTVLVFETPGIYRIQLVSRNLYGCEDTARYDFRVLPNLVAGATAANFEPCQFEAVAFQSTSQNADHWLWDFGDGTGATEENPVHAFLEPGSYDVSLIVRQDSFCADTFFFPVSFQVRPSPAAGFSVADHFQNGIADGTVICLDASVGAVQWKYEFTEPDTVILVQNPIVQYTSNAEKTIIQTVYNDIGCSDTAMVHFIPALFGGLVVPTAFMPRASQPGLHTVFKPAGAGLYSYKIEVFSALGDLVWLSERLEAGVPADSWDGTDFQGKDCPAGAYLWKVEAQLESTGNGSRLWQGMPVGKGGSRLSNYGTVTIIR